MKREDGFVLLRSLLNIAVVLVCTAALFAVLGAALRQNNHLVKRLNEEFLLRKEAIMERVQ
jgi:type II secretory pathway component PulJ